MALAVCATLSACSPLTADRGAAQSGDRQSYNSAPNGADSHVTGNGATQYNWILAIDSPKETITYLYAEKFSLEINRLSGGTMQIEIFTDGVLGSDVILMEGCARNTVNFVVQNTAPQVNYLPELAVFDLPAAYQDIRKVRRALDDESFMKTIDKIYRDGGYQLLGYADQTFRVLSSNKKITALSDFEGQNIRTMENTYHMAFWRLLGASPQPMPFGELHTALQQGYVTGQENPYAVIAANRFYEVQNYVMQTNHLPHIIALIMNLDEYQSLSGPQQEILQKAASIAKSYAREQADLWEINKIAEIRTTGTEIVPISDELFLQIREAVQPVYDQIIEKVGTELVDMYLSKR